MYFSRITLDATDPRLSSAGASAYGDKAYQLGGVMEDHKWLWTFFPHDPNATRDFTFRRLEGSRERPIGFYVVSKRKPQSPYRAWRVETREYDPNIEPGDRFLFDLRVNPVVTRNGVRHDVVMDAKTRMARESGVSAWHLLPKTQRTAARPTYAFIHECIVEWLCEENRGFAARHGFRIALGEMGEPLVRVDAYQHHALTKKARDAKFTSVDLSGELVVTDVERFRRTLFEGAGHAKVYGCGLFLIRRP